MRAHRELVGRERELRQLADLLVGARAGVSGAVLLRGPAGIGKTALLDEVAASADDFVVCRTIGVESDMELSYAGLQQLCAPIFGSRHELPPPLCMALEQVCGLGTGSRPNRFLVGLAVLELIVVAARRAPVLWIVDDPQWLDSASIEAIGFVSRRLPTHGAVLAVAARTRFAPDELADMPELRISGLGRTDSLRLLPMLDGPTDPAVRDRIIVEADGNPLALLELPRSWTAAEVAGEVGERSHGAVTSKLEAAFTERVRLLPVGAQTLLALAAAEPTGDPSLLWAAAKLLGLGPDDASPAERDGLIDIDAQVRFRHPLVRAVAYRLAPLSSRLNAHRALAEVTDPVVDADRRAWHRAASTVAFDEGIAQELERSAVRARARGGLLGAAALLERAALLTPHGPLRAERTLTAAQAKRDAGALDSALQLISSLELEPPTELRTALLLQLRGRIALDQGLGSHAAELLREAATRLEPFDLQLAGDTHFESLVAAIWTSGPEGPELIRKSADAAQAAPSPPSGETTATLVAKAIAVTATQGHAEAVPWVRQALEATRDQGAQALHTTTPIWPVVHRTAGILALEAWDFESGLILARQQVSVARESGALIELQFALHLLANYLSLAGDLADAMELMEEERQLSVATRTARSSHHDALVAAFRGESARALPLFDSMRSMGADTGQGRVIAISDYLSSVHHNALGQHPQALACAKRVMDWDVIGYRVLAASELAEASSRQGDTEALNDVAVWVRARVDATPTAWALGTASLVEAMAAEEVEDADRLYRDAVDRLGGTPLRLPYARAQLLYGEWLRRCGKKGEALQQLTAAHDALRGMGLQSFAERARRESDATTRRRVRSQLEDPTMALTGQELQVAQYAQSGLTNREIGVRLYLSPRTVEWHLRNVFGKVGASTRQQLRSIDLAEDATLLRHDAVPAAYPPGDRDPS